MPLPSILRHALCILLPSQEAYVHQRGAVRTGVRDEAENGKIN